MVEAYPLQWPEGFPRTRKPQPSRFRETVYDSSARKHRTRLTINSAMTEIHEQVRLLLGRKAWEAMKDNECIISTNMRRRKADGGIYANEKKPEDSGVAVYFMYQGNMRVVACDKWLTVKENLHAIAKTLEAMRGIDRWGASDMLNRMFTGFIGIPEEAGKDWYTVLGLSPKATEEEIKRAYRDKMKKIHPDIGGSDEAAAELTEAYKKAMKTVVDG